MVKVKKCLAKNSINLTQKSVFRRRIIFCEAKEELNWFKNNFLVNINKKM